MKPSNIFLGLLLVAMPAAGDWLVTADGRLVETQGSWKVSAGVVIYTDTEGKEQVLPLDEVDIEGSRETTALRNKTDIADVAPVEIEALPQIGAPLEETARIMIWVDSLCPPCNEAVALLRELGVPFTTKDLSQGGNILREYRKRTKRSTGGMPRIEVGERTLYGYDPRAVRRAVDELDQVQKTEAEELLAASRQALGGDALEGITSLTARADCRGPNGPFTTEVISLKPDSALMRQVSGGSRSEMVVVGDLGWQTTDGGAVALSRAMRGMVRGHEFHFLTFDLGQRFKDHRATGTTEHYGTPCREILMKDELGRPAAACFGSDDRPLYLEHLPPAGMGNEPIRVHFQGWQTLDGVTYVDTFVLRQGAQEFSYDYTEILPSVIYNEGVATLFEPPAELRENP